MISFISFGDSRLQESLDRIKSQAEQFGVFDEINVLCEHDLPQDFKEKHADKLVLASRGYGYWIWKSYLILEHLKKLQNGDILLYCDCGSHINPDGHKIFDYYLELVKSSEIGILGFSLEYLEYKWTKSDLLDYFGVLGNKDIILSPQIEAATIFIRKNDKSMAYIEKWYSVYEENFDLVNDTPSNIPNYADFKEHRHDQSIFSILGKLNNIATLKTRGNTYPSQKNDWGELYNKGCPILTRRDKVFKKEKRRNFFSTLIQNISRRASYRA